MRLFLTLLLSVVFVSCSNEGGSGEVVSKKDCTIPWGGILKHGEVIEAFKLALVQAPAKCESEQRTCNDGVLSGSFASKSCAVEEIATEPASHEKPMRINDKDLKVGGVKEMGQMSTWLGTPYAQMFSPKPKLEDIANCAQTVQAGLQCTKGTPICKVDQIVFSCETKTTYKVFGWVYEEIGRDYKPAKGVKADIFWFAGCFVGFCKPVVGPVLTDEWGYFELLTTSLNDQVRLDGTDAGLYAFCKDGKPIPGGGESGLQALVSKPFSDAFAHQKRIKPDSCKH